MAEPTYPLELTQLESQALTHLIAASVAAGFDNALEIKHGEELGVALDSLVLKVARLEQLYADEGQGAPPDEIAVFTARLDQRKAQLRDRGRG